MSIVNFVLIGILLFINTFFLIKAGAGFLEEGKN